MGQEIVIPDYRISGQMRELRPLSHREFFLFPEYSKIPLRGDGKMEHHIEMYVPYAPKSGSRT